LLTIEFLSKCDKIGWLTMTSAKTDEEERTCNYMYIHIQSCILALELAKV